MNNKFLGKLLAASEIGSVLAFSRFRNHEFSQTNFKNGLILKALVLHGASYQMVTHFSQD